MWRCYVGFNPTTYQLNNHSDAAQILDEANSALEDGDKAVHAEHETEAEAWATFWGLTRYQAAWAKQRTDDPNKYALLRVRRPVERHKKWIIEVTSTGLNARLRRI